MKKVSLIFIVFIVFTISSCQKSKEYTPKDLIKLTDKEIIERTKNLEYPNPNSVTYKNTKGEIISLDSLRKIVNPDIFATDMYVDKKGQVIEMVIRTATPSDKKLQKRLKEIAEEGPEVNMVDIDCSDVQNILQEVFDNDQEMRRNNQIEPKADHHNLEIVISIIEKCGMPKYNDVGEIPFWGIIVALQHSRVKYLKKYYPLLKQEMGVMPMVEDRVLMWEDKPQVYGSQISNGKLYDLLEPEKVNKRRAEVGLGPLQDYLDRWNIEFNVPQEE